MGVRRDLLLRFLLLYGVLYCSFGLSSPFLAARGIGSEWLGFLLGCGTAVRLLSAPFAGRLGRQVAPDGNANRSGTEGQRLSMSCNGKAGHGLSPDRNLSVKSQPRDRFPLLGRGAILGRL